MNVRKIPAKTPLIQYFGRWEKSLDACRCAQGATYIKANFTGRLLLADLTDPGNWWRVSIDGSPFRRFRPQGENTLLAENLSAGRHKVLLVRSTEGYMGISEFRGFFLERSEALLPPDPPKPRCLENEEKPLLEAQDYAGDNTHPLKNGSKKIALYLKDKVAEILGW